MWLAFDKADGKLHVFAIAKGVVVAMASDALPTTKERR